MLHHHLQPFAVIAIPAGSASAPNRPGRRDSADRSNRPAAPTLRPGPSRCGHGAGLLHAPGVQPANRMDVRVWRRVHARDKAGRGGIGGENAAAYVHPVERFHVVTSQWECRIRNRDHDQEHGLGSEKRLATNVDLGRQSADHAIVELRLHPEWAECHVDECGREFHHCAWSDSQRGWASTPGIADRIRRPSRFI